MEKLSIKELAKDTILHKKDIDLAKQLSLDNLYRNLAIFVFMFLVIIAFFAELASANFNWDNLWTAQFWISLTLTMGGGIAIKFIWGKYGGIEGHKNFKVIEAMRKLSDKDEEIVKENLVDDLQNQIEFSNKSRKIKAYKRKLYRLLLLFPRSKKLRLQRDCLIKYEKLENNNLAEEERDELTIFLRENNFDFDSKKVRYKKIALSSLRTGIPSKQKDEDENYSFNEVYELFGKTFFLYILSFSFTVLVAVAEIVPTAFTLGTVISFLLKLGVYVLNAVTGFAIAKQAVETVKLNVLSASYNYLARFLELKKTGSINEVISNGN